MTLADIFMAEMIEQILSEGFKDENPRPKYADGTPAHTISVNHTFRQYDLSKGEFPICTLRPIAWKTGIREIFAIYQNQSNKISEFERLGCDWWKAWSLEDGTIGKAYPYNLESHRPNEMTRGLIEAPIKITDKNFKEIKENETEKIGYLGKYKEVPNFTEEEVDILKNIWTNMIEKNLAIAIHPDWYSFEQFLKDIKFVPQYFLAREDNFLGWELNKDYYYSDLYSKDTCVFLQSQEIDFMAKTGCRFELSRNQIVELIKDIQNNPYGRRHIISFWHWANIDKKSLVECAYETIWNVRGEYLDMSLIQRSGDMLTASGPGGINEVQYAALLMMIARHTGYTPGIFTHFVANEQIYDRHIEAAKEISKRFTSLETTKECPKMILNPEKNNFFEFTIDDFTLENYNPIKPQLKLELGI